MSRRDEKVAEVADDLLSQWTTKLLAGDQRAISDLHNTVLDRLSEKEAQALFVRAATNPAAADVEFSRIAAKAMYDVCHADAERAITFIEKLRAEERDESRISQAMADRALH